MAVFTKALSNKWAPNAGRTWNEARDAGNASSIGLVGEAKWETGISKSYSVTFLGQISQPFPILSSSSDNPVDVQIVDVVEEAQLKGLIPMEATSASRGRLGNVIASSSSSSTSSELSRPRKCSLCLSIHGVKVLDPPSSKAPHVLLRLPLHSLLSAVSFQSQKEMLVALVIAPESESPSLGATESPGIIGGAPSPPFLSSASSTSSGDIVLASCLVFQAASWEDAATLVRDLKDVFVAAMNSKAPALAT